VFKGQLDDSGVEDFDVLNGVFVSLTEVIVPVSLLNIEDIVVESLNSFLAF
jgi:hypothetical protein